jgi:hypothetical protein
VGAARQGLQAQRLAIAGSRAGGRYHPRRRERATDVLARSAGPREGGNPPAGRSPDTGVGGVSAHTTLAGPGVRARYISDNSNLRPASSLTLN